MNKTTPISRQRGAVLIVSMMFLVILTMLGITAMTSTTFEERMAGNARDAAIASHAAEAALRDARDEILGFSTTKRANTVDAFTTGECTAGVCPMVRPDLPAGGKSNFPITLPPVPATVKYTKNDPAMAEYGSAWSPKKNVSNVSNQPRYLMELFCAAMFSEELSQPATCRIYRLTATAWGQNPNTRVTLQETFIKEKIK